jgi:acyl-CoA synthetase (AMP-forming)/AMP-acid ligase II
VVALLQGGRIVFRDRFDGEATLRLIERDRLTLWIAFPSMLMLALRSPGAAVDLGSLERLALGSSPSIQLLERFRARSSAAISTSYGLTEAGGGAVTATAADADLETIATTIGRPVAGIETRVVDGELLVRDSCLFLGYHNLPEATAAVLTDDGWLRTGDVVDVRPDGNLRLAGRLSDAFKSGGHNVYPAEVERVLAAHADVEAAAVVAVPDPLWEEVGVAFVVLRPGSHLDAEDLRRHARVQLANYKVPKRVHLLPALPQLPNGKYDKRSLRERALLG